MGHRPGRRVHGHGAARPRPGGSGRRDRCADVRGAAPSLERAGPRVGGAGSPRGRQRRDHVPQPPGLRRRLRGHRQARRRHPAPQHGVRGSAAGRGARARGPVGGDPRRGVHRAARAGRDRRTHPRLGRQRHRRGVDGVADPGVRRRRPRRAGAPLAHRHPDVRHDRDAEGRTPQRGRRRRRGLADVADAAALRLAHPHRRAAVPHLGVRPPGVVDAARLDRRAAPEVRARGVPAGRHGRVVRLPRRDPGDAAAGARAAGRHPRPLPTALVEGDGRVRLGAAGRPRPGVDGPVRRQPLQHLRLDRGRLRVDRDAARPACGADLGREAARGRRW